MILITVNAFDKSSKDILNKKFCTGIDRSIRMVREYHGIIFVGNATLQYDLL